MKRLFLPLFVFLLFVCNFAPLEASELEIIGGVDGLSFNPYKTDEYFEPDAENELPYYLYSLGKISFRHNISEVLNFSVNIERDKVLQNSLNVLFGVKTDYINVDFGIFAGLTDKIAVPDAGIIGNLELMVAKIVFLSLSGSSTLGAQYSFTSNNYRETAGVKLGFWLGNAVPSVAADMKTFSKQAEDDISINDTLYRFVFNTDFLIKNTNTTGYFNIGYQVYSRTYKKDMFGATDKLSSYFAGLGLYLSGKPLGFKIGAEFPFIISPEKPLTIKGEHLFFSKVYAGFVFTFE